MRAGAVPKPGMKSMNGGGGSMSRSTAKYVAPTVEKPKPKPKVATHSQRAAQWEANGRDANGKLIKHVEKKQAWTKEEVNRARDRAMEEQRRQAAVAVTPADEAGEELEAVPEGVQSAPELAMQRMKGLAEKLQALTVDEGGASAGPWSSSASSTVGGGDAGAAGGGARVDGSDDLEAIVECRRTQLDELAMLEAMFVEEYLCLSGGERLAELLQALDESQDTADPAKRQAVAGHPPLEFALLMTVRGAAVPQADPGGAAVESDLPASSSELVASILLRVRFPALYPTPGTPPEVYVEDCMVTAADATLGADKVALSLTTIGQLDEAALVATMLEVAAEAQPGPAVYEMVTSAVSQRALEFIRL